MEPESGLLSDFRKFCVLQDGLDLRTFISGTPDSLAVLPGVSWHFNVYVTYRTTSVHDSLVCLSPLTIQMDRNHSHRTHEDRTE